MISSADNSFRLKKRVAKLFGASTTQEIPSRDPVLRLLCKEFDKVSIFGGVIREMALGRPETFHSDIDIVVHAEPEHLAKVLGVFKVSRNRFGGFRFTTGRRMYDVWSLSATWAFKEGHVKRPKADFQILLQTTFFNIDAAYLSLPDGELHCSEEFLEGIRHRVLDINLLPNPNPGAMARRAHRLVGRGFQMRPSLKAFVEANSRH